MHSTSVGQTSYGIGIQKNSNFKYSLTRTILYLQEEGIILALQKKWLSTKCVTAYSTVHTKYSLLFFTVPLLGLTGIIIFSFFILLAEFMVGKYLSNKRQISRISGSIVHKPGWKTVTKSTLL